MDYPGVGASANGRAQRSEHPATALRENAPSLAGTAKRQGGSPVASEARWEALGNVAYLTAHSSARLVSLHMPSDRDTRKGGGRRGKVTYFSQGSRLRMIRKIHTVRRQAKLPCFVTLTFPDLFPTFEDAKRALDVLFKRWKRRWPGVSALWRIEAKARQSGSMAGNVAPHFHMLVWGAEFEGEKARADWFEICGSSEYAHWRHGYDGAMELDSWEKAAAYCAEYCAKKGNLDAPGRQWGIHNRQAFPRDENPLRVRLTWREAWSLRRTIRKAVAAKIGRKVKCAQSLYTSDPESLLRFVAMLRGNRHVKRRDDTPTPLRPAWRTD